MNEPKTLKRGESAEWCATCKLMVLPVGMGELVSKLRWVCPICSRPTAPRKE